MAEQKIQRSFIDNGFGFPIRLVNVPMIRVRGKWTPHINYNRLTQVLLKALYEKPVRLTGNEVRFICQHFAMTLQEFGARFSVSHVAVMKWEKAKDAPTGMNWASEKDLRMFVLSQMSDNAKDLFRLYELLEQRKAERKQTIVIDPAVVAA